MIGRPDGTDDDDDWSDDFGNALLLGAVLTVLLAGLPFLLLAVAMMRSWVEGGK